MTIHTINSVKEFLKERGGELLDQVKENGTLSSLQGKPGDTHLPVKINKKFQKYRWKCKIKEHNAFDATLNNVVNTNRGTWCPACARNETNQLGKVRKIIMEKTGECLSLQDKLDTFPVARTIRVKIKCIEGHIWNPLVSNILQGNWCRECYKKSKRRA